jgi:hypothetical protein
VDIQQEERWKYLRQQAVTERDPEKLLAIMLEINQAYEAQRSRERNRVA